MADHAYLHLRNSESTVAAMAATVFSSLIQQRELTNQNENELVERAVTIAIKLAVRTEQLVKSDEEWLKDDKSSPYMLG